MGKHAKKWYDLGYKHGKGDSNSLLVTQKKEIDPEALKQTKDMWKRMGKAEAKKEIIEELEKEKATSIEFWATKLEGRAELTETDELIVSKDEPMKIWNEAIDQAIKTIKEGGEKYEG